MSVLQGFAGRQAGEGDEKHAVCTGDAGSGRRGVVVSAGTCMRIFGLVVELGGSDASGEYGRILRGERQNGGCMQCSNVAARGRSS